ncbi:uncharacterized protein SCHCODRAFT_01046743, partial [Schizophyllum commune H4-8]|uniref:uncharacterized protein n=1 Tax=Schizophyllum commune (strain H4-8 / FGSC 9210) TaxID=578458 RepID=UPI00215F5842
CANARACRLCDNGASTDTLHVFFNVPHSPNLPYLITLPLPSTALAPVIRRVIVLPTIIS